MHFIRLAAFLALATATFADTVTLKSGRVINGTYLGGTSRQLRVETGDRVETLDITDVQRIEFGTPAPAPATASAPAPAPAAAPAPAPAPRPDNLLRPDTRPEVATRTGSVELPAGTNFVIRMIDGVDSETNHVGENFHASLDQPVTVGGETVVPRGADVTVRLVDARESGKLTGRAEVALSLVSIMVDGRAVDINTQTVSRESDARGQRTAKVAGGTAAVGAIIGAIAGGGKGAAIGAAAGGAAGAGSQVITKGQRVKIPSETRLTFVLDNAVTL
jgi:hypothetical protein